MVLQSTQGEHTRVIRECVLEIRADLHIPAPATKATYGASIKIHRTCYATLFCFRDGDNLLLTVMELIYHRQFFHHFDICKEFTSVMAEHLIPT